MFHFSGFALRFASERFCITKTRFPHSEITGSKVASHLPDAYRRHATSFITLISQGIRHSLITYFLSVCKACAPHNGRVSNRYRFYVSLTLLNFRYPIAVGKNLSGSPSRYYVGLMNLFLCMLYIYALITSQSIKTPQLIVDPAIEKIFWI